MATPLPDPPALHDRAIQDLSFIRRTMEGASAFTDVPGWGLVLVGVSALATAAVARLQPTAGRWLAVWLAEAVLAVLLALVMMRRKMRRRGQASPTLNLPARKFLLGFWPAIAAGAVLTAALVEPADLGAAGPGSLRVLPGVWLLLYGVGVVTAGAFSVRAVPIMGMGFLALGTIALLARGVPGDLLLALGFGVLQVVFGVLIARRHGG
jgi:hypothetical protein